MPDHTADTGQRPSCESCNQPADIRLRDGSTWCDSCNESAHNLGYDQLKGRRIKIVEVAS